jgi:Nif-specific regulatory protein
MQESQLGTLVELVHHINKEFDYDEILRLVASKVSHLLEVDVVNVQLLNPQTRKSVRTAIRGGSNGHNLKLHKLNQQITGWMLQNKQSIISPDIYADKRFRGLRTNERAVCSVVGGVMRFADVSIGSILAYRKPQQRSFSKDDLEYLNLIAAISAPYLSNFHNIQQFFHTPPSEGSLLRKYEAFGLLGRSKPFVNLLKSIEAATRCDVRVVLEGESGTGKDLIASAIHQLSDRREKQFVAIDCGAIPQHLLESELFGHVKGAFTGAISNRKGLFELANGGTLFMDEIANLAIETQVKLLRVLQQGEIRPVGSDTAHQVDVRIISACSHPLSALVRQRQFRDDLYYRLNVYPVIIPSLNDRIEDIPYLASHFLCKFGLGQDKKCVGFCDKLQAYMQNRRWTGNIRELENFIERLVTLVPDDKEIVDHHDLPPDLLTEMKDLVPEHDEYYAIRRLSQRMAEFEAFLIRKALNESGWNQSKAARSLSIPVQTMRYKMTKHHILPPAS